MATPIDGIGAGYTNPQTIDPARDIYEYTVRPRQGAEQLVDQDVVRRQASATNANVQDKPATADDSGVRLDGNLARLAEAREGPRPEDEQPSNDSGTYSPAQIREGRF
ncbi:MAG: hypothetical protein AAF984_03295 [Verrucomicrobiota bacterium]